jgi:hypothetical protein
MAAFSIHASKDGQSVVTVRIGPTVTVAKARELGKSGQDVHITDADGRQYRPDKFDQLLSFDRRPAIKF